MKTFGSPIYGDASCKGPLQIYKCPECQAELVIASDPASERPDDAVTNAWSKGWGSLG